MQAYSVYYRIEAEGWRSQRNSERVDAKNRDSAIRKVKRKLSKLWRIDEEQIVILSVGTIGYF
jgi:hypothetical protein